MKSAEMLEILGKLGPVGMSYPEYAKRTTVIGVASCYVHDRVLKAEFDKAKSNPENFDVQPTRSGSGIRVFKPEFLERHKETVAGLQLTEKNRSAAIRALFEKATGPNAVVEQVQWVDANWGEGGNVSTYYRYDAGQKDWVQRDYNEAFFAP